MSHMIGTIISWCEIDCPILFALKMASVPRVVFADSCVKLKRQKNGAGDENEIVDRGIIDFKLYELEHGILFIGHQPQSKRKILHAVPVYKYPPRLHTTKKEVVVIKRIDESSYKVNVILLFIQQD